jgi:hypothetical protein
MGNPATLLTRHHGTARHSQLPKLDVAASFPVARSNDAHQSVAWSDQGPALPTNPHQAPNTSWGRRRGTDRRALRAAPSLVDPERAPAPRVHQACTVSAPQSSSRASQNHRRRARVDHHRRVLHACPGWACPPVSPREDVQAGTERDCTDLPRPRADSLRAGGTGRRLPAGSFASSASSASMLTSGKSHDTRFVRGLGSHQTL